MVCELSCIVKNIDPELSKTITICGVSPGLYFGLHTFCGGCLGSSFGGSTTGGSTFGSSLIGS